MKQVYNRRFAAAFATGGSTYVLSEQIQPGKILEVLSCCAYSAQREASDDVIIGVRNGGGDIILTAMAPLAAQSGVSTQTPFLIGEGDKIFASFPDVDDTDVIELHINGILHDVDSWEKQKR